MGSLANQPMPLSVIPLMSGADFPKAPWSQRSWSCMGLFSSWRAERLDRKPELLIHFPAPRGSRGHFGIICGKKRAPQLSAVMSSEVEDKQPQRSARAKAVFGARPHWKEVFFEKKRKRAVFLSAADQPRPKFPTFAFLVLLLSYGAKIVEASTSPISTVCTLVSKYITNYFSFPLILAVYKSSSIWVRRYVSSGCFWVRLNLGLAMFNAICVWRQCLGYDVLWPWVQMCFLLGALCCPWTWEGLQSKN